MILQILRKDWILFWPLAVLVLAIQAALEWALFRWGIFGDNLLAAELTRLLPIAWMVGIFALAIAVVQEDPIPGAEQDWLIRPLSRADLLLAKLLFLLLTVSAPMLILNVLHETALGFPPLQSFGEALYKETFVFLTLLLPVMALASITRNMVELLLLAAALVVLFTLLLGSSAALFGEEHCPTCGTALVWLQHLWQHVAVMVGSVVILALQYFRRRTNVARGVAFVGVGLWVFAQVTWDMAFAIGARLSPASDAPAIGLQAGRVTFESQMPGARKPSIARHASDALLHGNVGAAVDDLTRSDRAGTTQVLDMPVRVGGTTAEQFLFSDRAMFSLLDSHRRVLYQGRIGPRGSKALLADNDAPASAETAVSQILEIPGPTYQRISAQATTVESQYWLTLMEVVSVHRLNAVGGKLRSPDVGVCRSRADPTELLVRCEQIGRAPICYRATLYGPDGSHNPAVLECSVDYRPYIPSAPYITTLTGFELPTRDPSGLAHYPVPVSDLQQAYIEMQIYAVRSHFVRAISAALPVTEP